MTNSIPKPLQNLTISKLFCLILHALAAIQLSKNLLAASCSVFVFFLYKNNRMSTELTFLQMPLKERLLRSGRKYR